MAENKGWLPKSRAETLNMAFTWENMLIRKGTRWNVKSPVIIALHRRAAAAQSAFETALSSERTPALTAATNKVFAKLEALMEHIKSRYFTSPPLLDEDFAFLLLPPENEGLPVIPCPTSRPLLLLYYEGDNTVAVDITVMLGENPPSNCRAALFRGVMLRNGASEAAAPYLIQPPRSGEGLFKWLDTKRKRERAWFPPENQCKAAYFCARYVNEKGETGPWGPLAALVIPGAEHPLCPKHGSAPRFGPSQVERRRPSRRGG